MCVCVCVCCISEAFLYFVARHLILRPGRLEFLLEAFVDILQEGLTVASIARDDPSTLPSDDPFPRARMHRDRHAR